MDPLVAVYHSLLKAAIIIFLISGENGRDIDVCVVVLSNCIMWFNYPLRTDYYLLPRPLTSNLLL